MAETSLSPVAGVADEPAVLHFDRFTLDLGRAELRRDGAVVPLRPKAFDLLAALAAHPGRVLSKDELMSAVWPGVVVTDDSLTQCVHELRQALGDRAAALLRTVPRRGYRFDAEPVAVPPAAADGAGALGAGAPVRPIRRRHLVVGAAVLLLAIAAAWLWRPPASAPTWQAPQDLARTPLPQEVPALSVVVLPLVVEGPPGTPDWLADALHGDLVADLARLYDLHVIGRDTAATYKGRSVDPRQVARELGVRHVVQGRLRQDGDRLQLAVSLIDGETGVQRWADTFDTDRAQLPQMAGDLAVAVVRALVGELFRSAASRRAALSPEQVNADDLAMRGYALWYRGVTRENILAGRELFERAVQMNPDSVRAWSGIQFTTANQLLNGWADDRAAVLRRQHDALENLERLDRDGSQTYSARSFVLFARRDFPAMLVNTTEWTQRHRLPLAWGAHGAALMLNARFDEAVVALERALRLGPRDPFRAEWQYRLALAHFFAGRYELARDWSQSAANTTPTLVWPPIHAAAMHRLGQTEQAQRAFDEHRRRHPAFAASQVINRMPGTDPAYAEARERLLASLRALGLR